MVNIHCDTILRDFSSAFLGKKSKKVFLWSSELNNLAIILSRNLEYKLPVKMDKNSRNEQKRHICFVTLNGYSINLVNLSNL